MGLLIAFIVLFVWGVLANKDFSSLSEIFWQVVAILFFYWVGTILAPISDCLTASWSLRTVAAGVCYLISGWLAFMRICVWLR